jgi:hypothetical protein
LLAYESTPQAIRNKIKFVGLYSVPEVRCARVRENLQHRGGTKAGNDGGAALPAPN